MDGYRLNISTRWFFIGIALNPRAKFASLTETRWLYIHRY
jgi:hypothetical protein